MIVESSAKLLPAVTWKTENVPNEPMGLDQKICKQKVRKANWLLSNVCAKIQIESYEPKIQLFSFQEQFIEKY